MRIGVLAARAGITASRVRFYEARGLLPDPARRDSGYRDYDDQALEDLRLIGRARSLGYTLKDIATYLKVTDPEGRKAYLLACVHGRLTEVDGLLSGLQDQQASLETLRQDLQDAGPA